MDRQKIIKDLVVKTNSKIVLFVMDGLGDLPKNGKTPLQAANTPNMDSLAKESDLGQSVPVLPGITPGSGPGHLSLFGYDPLKYQIGRGILEALGLGIDVGEKDVVARGNFATIKDGIIVDRRAGRPSSEESKKVVDILSEKIKKVDDVEINFYPGKEHRFVVKFTGEGLFDEVSDADPQREGSPMEWAKATNPDSEKMANIVNKLIKQIGEVLKDQPKMNFALLRGFSKHPIIPSFEEVYKLKAAAIATYPMYKGLSKLVGMEVLEAGQTLEDEVQSLKDNWEKYDFFYFHVKKTDSYGEDGNFEEKVKVIESVDEILKEVLSLNPDVLIITGDHSTPSLMKSHSWHPVPVLLHSKYVRKGLSVSFDEYECARGSLGTISGSDIMTLALANAEKLEKYGA
ncbi:2,3-bisphosphoglycerate-independent phosphoglycerate mutase [Petrotoga sp. 9PWA.NaAc.5.4]|uniref:2,3-bisphosphoglycerate-independent phosphoglycerate mutase n=1 Tax=Petrotoga sp. 9PWA.NaAc.5.4 TaxID=1434328 RepID=UPI000CBAF13B|nr:phosphoglycerate mutase [Petrotoga sp. 9PWA.NaAc.5.4]